MSKKETIIISAVCPNACKEYEGDMPTGYSTIEYSNGAATTLSNFETDEFHAGEWNKTVIDDLAKEIPQLIARSQWLFAMPLDKLIDTIEREIAVDAWAAKGAYGPEKKHLHWKLHRNLEWSIGWAKEGIDGEMICRTLFAMACEALYEKNSPWNRLALACEIEEKTA